MEKANWLYVNWLFAFYGRIFYVILWMVASIAAKSESI